MSRDVLTISLAWQLSRLLSPRMSPARRRTKTHNFHLEVCLKSRLGCSRKSDKPEYGPLYDMYTWFRFIVGASYWSSSVIRRILPPRTPRYIPRFTNLRRRARSSTAGTVLGTELGRVHSVGVHICDQLTWEVCIWTGSSLEHRSDGSFQDL